MDANGLVDTGLTPERLAKLDIGKTLATAWKLVRTQRSTYPIAMEFLEAYLRRTTPNPIPLWRMRESTAFVDAVDRMTARITAALERCAEAAGRVGARTAYFDSVLSITGGDQTARGTPVEYVADYADWDLFGALGTFNIQVVRVSINLFKTQDKWTASGQADFEYHDKYDFDQHDNYFNQLIRDTATRWFASDSDVDIAALDALEKAGLAKKFEVRVPWTETFPVSPLQGTWTGAP